MVDDYTTQATRHADEATVTPKEGDWYAPDGTLSAGWMVHSKALNMSIDMEAATEDAARTKATEFFADTLRLRDPNYVPAPVPTAADAMLAAVEALDPQTATVIATAKSALVDAGATAATVSP